MPTEMVDWMAVGDGDSGKVVVVVVAGYYERMRSGGAMWRPR